MELMKINELESNEEQIFTNDYRIILLIIQIILKKTIFQFFYIMMICSFFKILK